jgi:UDP-hydrolysing UDP-N-acetyl-D-glucosamine 2-epimerase
VRNALTKMAHIHFTSTEAARERVIAMGEEEWRVHRAGAPSLDHLRRSKLLSRPELESKLGCELGAPPILVSYHPVTLAKDTLEETAALFAALGELSEPLFFCYPNADAGSRKLIDRTKEFLGTRRNGRLFVNLDAVTYWSLLRQVQVFVGNSSSGIMETGSFALPTVNVGMRQQGRERGKNVLDAGKDSSAILAAIRVAQSTEFRASLQGMRNVYGDGTASEKIAEVLSSVPLGQELLVKLAARVGQERVGVGK